MTANVGKVDRIIRAVLGVVLLALALGYVGVGIVTPWDWVLGIAGAALLGTAIVSVCPAYALIGVRTCEQ